MTPEMGTQLISTLGVLVVLAWYMYYNVTVTVPTIVKLHTDSERETAVKFAEASERKAELFANTQKEIAANFSSTLKEERAYRREEISALKVYLKAEAEDNCKYKDDCKYNQGK